MGMNCTKSLFILTLGYLILKISFSIRIFLFKVYVHNLIIQVKL